VTEQIDIQALHNLVSRHHHFTGSLRARRMLDQWGDYLPKFVKVFPHEYKRVLQNQLPKEIVSMVPQPHPVAEVVHGD